MNINRIKVTPTLFSFILFLGIPSPMSSQESSSTPLRVETTFGYNLFTHSGINDDMKVIRDSTKYSDYDIPIGKFGKDYNYGIMISTLLVNDITLGISLQYYGTRSYYSYTGTTTSPQTAMEVEYAFSRIAPQLVVEYSHQFMAVPQLSIGVNGLIGIVFVNMRKDFNFAYTPQSVTPPFFLPPFALHVIGQYEAINPEYGLQLSCCYKIVKNVRIKTSIGWVISPSKETPGTFNSVMVDEIMTNEYFKKVLLRNIDLGYHGYTFGGGLEFGF